MERLIYFDHNSTTPYSPSVSKYLKQDSVEDWYNPSSVYPSAQVLYQRIRESREFIANHLNCSPKHLFFTSGGTESINTILSVETLKLNQLFTCITSHLEHHATIKKIDCLSKNSNIKICWVSNNEQGEVNLDDLEATCSKHPHSLLSFLSANNETGVITDIQAVSKIARKYDCLVHVDAVQSLGKTSIDLEKLDVDFASFSGHKIGAMKGIGLLYARKLFAPLMYGGGQERGLRPGTHNYPAIQSVKLAVQDIDLNKQNYVKKLRDYLEQTLSSVSNSSTIKINCNKANRLPNTSNIYCGGISNQTIILALAKKGIYISEGSACNAGSPEPSHVITNLNVDSSSSHKDYARSCIRVSLSPSNTKEEIDSLIKSLPELVSSLSYVNTNPPVQSA
ncbi:MAG: cysteine desulfurase family protein [Bdellovibrionales bacterium]|nr:cysteine desulfurase family protein [Bdellovibrionales bacterium]